jgi:hypothetical protein
VPNGSRFQTKTTADASGGSFIGPRCAVGWILGGAQQGPPTHQFPRSAIYPRATSTPAWTEAPLATAVGEWRVLFDRRSQERVVDVLAIRPRGRAHRSASSGPIGTPRASRLDQNLTKASTSGPRFQRPGEKSAAVQGLPSGARRIRTTFLGAIQSGRLPLSLRKTAFSRVFEGRRVLRRLLR